MATAQTAAAPKAAAPAAPKATARKKTTARPKAVRSVNEDPIHSTMHETQDALAHFDNSVHENYSENWKPPAHLEAPEPRAGWVQRWIRTDLVGKADGQNVASASRTGWMPRPLTTIVAAHRKRYTAVRSKAFGDVIKSGDLILCEMPQKRFRQMQDFYRTKARGQVDALVSDHIAKQNASSEGEDGFGPIRMTRKSKVTVRRPIVASDDEG
jgi:hypothetical protein